MIMVVSSHELIEARIHSIAETGDIPLRSRSWYTARKITWSTLVELTTRTEAAITDFITVKSGAKVVAEIAEVSLGNTVRYYQTA